MYSVSPRRSSHPVLVERWRYAAAVELQGPLLADCVRPLKDPVLPRAQTSEDLGFHRLRAGKSQVRFHASHRVGREAGTFLQHHPQFVVPVEVLIRGGYKAKFGRRLALDRRTDFCFDRAERLRLAKKAGFKPRQSVAHRVGAEIRLPQRDPWRNWLSIVAFARTNQHQRAIGSESQFRQGSGKARARLDQRNEALGGHIDALENTLEIM